MSDFTHINNQGNARMTDVSEKEKTMRTARAKASVLMSEQTIEAVRTGGVKKGDVLSVAQVAGIQAAKHNWELIPMCHQINLTSVNLEFEIEKDRIVVFSEVKSFGQTGVEMEALAAVGVAALTIYDMCKAIQKDMTISDIMLLEKTGGKSGTFRRPG